MSSVAGLRLVGMSISQESDVEKSYGVRVTHSRRLVPHFKIGGRGWICKSLITLASKGKGLGVDLTIGAERPER